MFGSTLSQQLSAVKARDWSAARNIAKRCRSASRATKCGASLGTIRVSLLNYKTSAQTHDKS